MGDYRDKIKKAGEHTAKIFKIYIILLVIAGVSINLWLWVTGVTADLGSVLVGVAAAIGAIIIVWQLYVTVQTLKKSKEGT